MPEKVIENGILLTFDEIRVLLYGMGVSQIEGIYMPEKVFCESEILEVLKHLSDVGFIEAGEEKFLIREDVRAILEVMASPERTDIWRPRGEEGPAFFLYRKGTQVAASEMFLRKKDMLRLSLMEAEAFETWREEWTDDHHRG